ncbi:MAG: GIY-YIG nuclease family protein [Mesorhizobium sp.]|nr:MAG: GIY-YIG nuclease family protein [Mesorhizobium sp.]
MPACLDPTDLYKLASMSPGGVTQWGNDVPSSASGVYVISVADPATVILKPDLNVGPHIWQGDQPIVYVGRAKNLRKRLSQFRRHKFGRSAPHRGGQAILLLDAPLTITWAEVADYAHAEDRLITIFREQVGRMPFGNRVRSARTSPAP